jgi:Lon protease-like protein
MTFDIGERELPLFPLQAVLFPGGLLNLTVFEARYLDLVTTCLRERRPFGVVALLSGREVEAQKQRAQRETVSFESIGTLAELISVDSDSPGILKVRCNGTQRFMATSSRQQAGGLWLADAESIEDDESIAPSTAMTETVRALATTIGTLKTKNEVPFLEPYRFDDAGWVANRWCEILPISQTAKQKLMELPDPTVRLQLVDDFLRSKGVVT